MPGLQGLSLLGNRPVLSREPFRHPRSLGFFITLSFTLAECFDKVTSTRLVIAPSLGFVPLFDSITSVFATLREIF
jgi:hypothetical protein